METVYNGSIILIILLLILGLTGCNGGYYEERIDDERSIYENRINELIATIDDELEVLREEQGKENTDRSEKIDGQIQSLEQVRSDLDNYKNEILAVSEDEWMELRGEVDDVLENAENELQDSLNHK